MFSAFVYLYVFPCDTCFSCALFVCINKENVCCWDTDWSLERMLAFFTPFISKKQRVAEQNKLVYGLSMLMESVMTPNYILLCSF